MLLDLQQKKRYIKRFPTKSQTEVMPFGKTLKSFIGTDGRPQINQERLGIASIEAIDVSLAHIAEYAVANVVVTIKEKE